jgi:HD superfamily phosphohydrolase
MKTIYCAVHGYTHWEEFLVKIINTEEFQRLKHIRQLATVHHVFPCATNTRFEHSLGVGHLAEKFAISLKKKHPELEIDPLLLKLTGLCHDLGHGPLSHVYDTFLESHNHHFCKHEERSELILRLIDKKYNLNLHKYLEDACELINPKKQNLPLYMYQIISNDMNGVDVDKLDYLARDSMFTGMKFNVDVERFFEYARIINTQICYSLNHMPHIINHTFMIRHQLHALVYQHSVVRAIEYMYMDYMKLMETVLCDDTIEEFITRTDNIFTYEFVELQFLRGYINETERIEANRLLTRINTRSFYKLIYEVKTFKRLKSINSKSLILDTACIGYKTNPLFKVQFYKNGKLCKLGNKSSNVFPKEAHDIIYRLYVK